jgi:phage terminase large subunit GpA-like protein
MTTVAPASGPVIPVICEQCGGSPAAPDYAEHFSEEGLVLYLWTCPHCGNRFGTELAADVTPEAAKDAVEAFWPSLLVG